MAIPPVLVHPPWRGARSRPPAERPVLDIPEAREAPRLVWAEGERGKLRGPGAKLLEGAAEERVFERLFDHIDRQKILPALELARLGDERLLEIAEELSATSVDVPGLRLLLARLGEAFVAQAVALVRAAPPERGLFEAMAPVRAADLARIAATTWAHRELPDAEVLARPFVPAPADAWLLRFPDAAAAGLIPAALDEASSAHRAVRSALAWIAARGGMDAMRPVLASAREAAGPLLSWLLPFEALAALQKPWIAFLAARGQDAAALALLGDVADPAPAALYVARLLGGSSRAAAVTWLTRRREVVEPALSGYASISEEAAVALEVLGGDALAGDPAFHDVPDAIPPLPAFFDADKLPAPRLADGTPLPGDAIRTLGEMLRFSSLARPYPGVAQVRAACDAGSLDAFALALLERWGESGEDPANLWVLETAGKLGGDACAREVGRRVRAWARAGDGEGERPFVFARTGCAALAANGTDHARMQLDDLARTASASWLRREAKGCLEKMADGHPARAEAAVPDLGLDEQGGALFDLGGRSFRVGFDEALTPHLVADGGERLRAFPRSRKEDDPARYEAARKRFQELTRDGKVLARQQVAELEAAMCSQRTWALAAFHERFVMHPLLRHLGRRLVWATEDLSVSFRVAEDLSYADDQDGSFSPPAGVKVVLAHPVLLSADALSRWVQILADYEIIQPLPQIGREIHTPREGERAATQISRVRGQRAIQGKLLGLPRRGWRARVSGEWVEGYLRDLQGGAQAAIDIDPSISVTGGGDSGPHTITSAICTQPLGRLPPVEFSELIRDLEWMCA